MRKKIFIYIYNDYIIKRQVKLTEFLIETFSEIYKASTSTLVRFTSHTAYRGIKLSNKYRCDSCHIFFHGFHSFPLQLYMAFELSIYIGINISQKFNILSFHSQGNKKKQFFQPSEKITIIYREKRFKIL